MPHYNLGFTTLEEEIEIDNLPVRGQLPSWLSGTLVRNGPAKFEVGEQSYRHWFDGLSMLRRFTFHDGVVLYANQYLKSRDYSESMRRGKISMGNFATDPCRSIFQRIFSMFSRGIPDNANVNVARIAERYIAMTETPIPIKFDPQTLETLGVFDYGEDDVEGTVTTAHPHFDYARGIIISYNTQFSRHSKYIVYRIPEGSLQREPIAMMPVRKPAYMHSFGMTDSHVILVEFPLVVNPVRLLLLSKPFIENYRWEPKRGTRFHLISKDDGSVRSYRSKAFFAFHHVNAFEKEGNVFVDIAAYPDTRIIDALYLEHLRAGDPIPQAELRRYRLSIWAETASYEPLITEPIELPRLNYERNGGKDYRYAYGVGNRRDRPAEFLNQLIKVDVRERSAKVWRDEDCYVGEPVFVAAPNATTEDEGVVLDARKSTSFLLVLDAGSFEELARAEVPHYIPFEFHGEFFAE